MRTKVYRLEMYHFSIIITDTETVKELEREYPEAKGIIPEDEDIFASTFISEYTKTKDCQQAIYFTFNSKHDCKIDVSAIAHEAFHGSHLIWQHIGAKMDEYNPEPQAYLIGYLAGLINKFLKSNY